MKPGERQAGKGKHSRKARIGKFARALVKLKTQRQAAIEAGFSKSCADSKGSVLAKTPEVKEAVKRLLEAEGLDAKRTVKELRRGLDEGELSPHGYYLDRLMRLQGLDPAPASSAEGPAPINIMLAFLEALDARSPNPLPLEPLNPRAEQQNQNKEKEDESR